MLSQWGVTQTLRQQLKEAEQNYNTLQTFVKDHPELQTDTSFLVRYARHDFWWQHRAGADGSYATYYGQLHEYMQNQTNNLNTTQQWENPGPRYMAQNGSNIGRVNSIWIDPKNSDHIKIGSASAGLWETTNGGDNWVILTPEIPGGVRDFIVHPTNPNLVYGISEIHNNGMYHHWGGYGIFKSTDGGANPEMKLTHLYLEHKGIKEILFKPGDPQTIYVLTDHRIFISHNAGENFTDVSINSAEDKILEDLAFSETYPDVGFAYSRGQLYRTTDGGYSWTDVYSSVPVDWGVVWDQTGQNECFNSVSASYRGYGGRNVMGAFDDEIYIFRHSIVIQNNDTTFEKELLVSDVNTLSFQRHNSNNGFDPYNIRKAQNGNIGICTRSYFLYFDPETDSWDSRYSSRHQDVRDVAFHGTDNVDFILATDGGVEYGTDAYYPTYINGDLALNEIHGHTVFQSKRDHYRVGTHDDGGFYQDENGWHEAKDGQNEGAICWQNQSNFKEYAYAYGYSKVGKVMEDDYDILATIPSTSLGAIFFQDPNDQNSFWKQNGSKFYKYTPSVSGASIQDTIGALLNGTSGALLRFSEQNSDIMYASIYHPWEHWFNLSKSTDGGTVWERLDGSSPDLQAIKLTGLRISDIEINPENSDELWITFSRFMENDNIRVLHSIDGGYNWDDITGNLPDIPVTQIEFDLASGRLFVGSDVGLFEREAGEWECHANFPVVPVIKMTMNDIYQDLTVSTYGRGVWRTNLSCAEGNLITFTTSYTYPQTYAPCACVLIKNGADLTTNHGFVMAPLANLTIEDGTFRALENVELAGGDTVILKNGANVELAQTLVLPVGAEMQIRSGATVDFHGSEIELAEGATLIISDGTTLKNITISGAGDVLFDGENITLQNVVYNMDLVCFNGLSFVGSFKANRKFTIPGNVSITLPDQAVLTVNGKCTINGYAQVNGMDAPATATMKLAGSFSIAPNAEFNNLSFNGEGGLIIDSRKNVTIEEVVFNHSNFTAHQAFSDIVLKNNVFNGSSVHLDLFSDFVTGYCQVLNNEFANITAIYNSGNLNLPARSISGNKIYGHHNWRNNAVGLLIYSSVAEVHNNTICDNDYGLKLHHKSHIRMYGDKVSIDQDIYSEVYGNDRHQILAYDNSFPWKFELNVIDGQDSPYPWIEVVDFSTPTFDVYDVRNNCWSGHLNLRPNLVPAAAFESNPAWDCGYTPGPLLPYGPEQRFLTGIAAIENESYSEAETTMKTVVADYPESSFAASAMKTLPMLTLELGQPMEDLIGYFSNTVAIQNQPQLAKLATYLTAECHIKDGGYQSALTIYESIIDNPPTMEDSIYAQIDAGRVQYLMEQEGNKAPVTFKYQHMIPKTHAAFTQNRKILLDKLQGVKTEVEIPLDTEPVTDGESLTQSFKLYPNPVSDMLRVEFAAKAQGNATLTVYNSTGQVVYTVTEIIKKDENNSYNINTEELEQGVYVLQLSTKDTETISRRFVISR